MGGQFGPGLLQRLGDFRRHVIFIMLGQHRVGQEDIALNQLAVGDDALSLPEQIRQYAFIVDFDLIEGCRSR